jgi:RND family efflux transporter MFP subunit
MLHRIHFASLAAAALIGPIAANLASCGGQKTEAGSMTDASPGRLVSVVKAEKKNLQRQLSVSSELVPFQQIDVYAKEAGYVRQLNVDYGTHVRAGQVMAVLEIPELQMQLDEDDAMIADANDQVTRARNEISRDKAQHEVLHLQFDRLNKVATSKPGLVTPQEVDDWHGRDLAAEAQVDAADSALQSAQSRLNRARARRRHDQAIFDYSKIAAPFDGVVTERYANLGTLMQSGTGSSTQAMPLVQLSEDNIFRLVIPVAEAYVRYIRIGDPVDVRVPSLGKSLSGRVARFSTGVTEDTRTMHTEVDVPNPSRALLPGVYAEATLTLDRKQRVVTVPPEAVNLEGEQKTVWVVDSAGRIEVRNIAVGIETPNAVEVASGLREGELVVVGDRSNLRAGEVVRPKEVQLLQYQTAQQ